MEKTSIDAHIGGQLRKRRKELELTAKQLGDELSISGPQIMKYESGVNRVSASTLWQLSVLLRVQVSYFFEGLSAHKLSKPVGTLKTLLM